MVICEMLWSRGIICITWSCTDAVVVAVVDAVQDCVEEDV
jgi:hypothetical protein